MHKQKDALLQQILDNNKESTVRYYQEAIGDLTKLLRLNPKHTYARRHLRTVERTLRRLNSMK